MYRVLSVFLCALAIPPAAALAQTRWIECPGCTEASARAQAEQGVAPATRIFFDAGASAAWKFEVQREQVGPGCHTFRPSDPKTKSANTPPAAGQCQNVNVAYAMALDTSEMETVQSLHDFFVATGGTWKITTPISRDAIFIPQCDYCVQPEGSGFDVVNDIMYRNQVRRAVLEYANAMTEIAGRLLRLVGQGVEIRFLGGDMTMTFIVEFPDGTKVPVVINDSSPDGHIDPELVTAPDGSAIMTSANIDQFRHYEAVYPSQQAVDNFLRNAERLGAVIAGRGPNRVLVCTWRCTRPDNGIVADCHLECRAL